MSYRCTMDALDKRQIAGLVKAGRAAKGYTQQELADRTGITLRSVQRIENGDVLPRTYTLRLLEEQLGIDLSVNVTAAPTGEPIESTGATLTREELDAVPSQQPGLSKGRKWILTICLGLLLLLLTTAYLAQSAHWPETDFERLLLWSGVLAVYSGILWKIWK